MPNHIANHIETSKHVIDAIMSKDEDGFDTFDFNTLIPIPDHIYQGNIGAAEREKYGEDNWYDWCSSPNNWNTKWNAYDVSRNSDTVLTFSTAWSHPFPIIKALSELCPDEEILVAYADENTGFNFGVYLMMKGRKIREAHIDEGSFEATKLANLLSGRDTEEEILTEIGFLKEHWDEIKDRPNASKELAGYKRRLKKLKDGADLHARTNPDVDLTNVYDYLNLV